MGRSSLLGILDNFERRGRETAFVFRRGYRTVRWPYGQVAQSAFQFAHALDRRGLRKGDRVLLWGDNCAEWVAAFLGCMLRGVVAVPMDLIAAPDFALRVCRQVDVRLCLCSRETADKISSYPFMILEELTEQLSEFPTTRPPAADATRDDPVQIVFTSGTTADPKGVVITHRNVLANLEPLESEIGRYLAYERLVHPLRFLNLLPLSHVFGQFLGIFVPQLLGATVVFHDSLNPSEIVRTIKQQRVSVLVAVPRLLETLRNKIERDHEATGRLAWLREQIDKSEGEHFVRRWWRFRAIHRQFGWKFWAFISGGAALDAHSERFWGRLGFAVIQGYGLTETTSLVSVNHPFKLGRGSIGKALPGREIRLGENGEILVRGESIAAGYVSGRELEPIAGPEGWLHTGDIGELDAQGNLYFKGRRKSVIVNPEGMNIYPEDLEAALRLQPEVRDCVVVGLEREGNAEPCAVLILQDRAADAEAAVKRANESLAQYQRIRRWLTWPEEDFPRTPTQKPRVAAIQEFVHSRFQGEPGSAPSAGGLADLIARITGRPAGQLSAETNLATDLELSSLDRVELLGALEDRYQVDLNESRFSSATTVGELDRMLAEPVALRTDYRYPRWARNRVAAGVRFVVYYLLTWPATRLMCSPAVSGRENLGGQRGPVLFISNHITQVDIGFILAALPLRYRHRLCVAMLGEMLQAMRHPPADMAPGKRLLEMLSYFLVVLLFHVFPLPQRTGFRESFTFAGEAADRGYSVLVFPEGRRTQDGALAPFQAGIGLLARNLGLPIVPMRIDGLYELKQKGKRLVRPGTVKVTIGPPRRYAPEVDPAEIARDLEACMRRMAPAAASPRMAE